MQGTPAASTQSATTIGRCDTLSLRSTSTGGGPLPLHTSWAWNSTDLNVSAALAAAAGSEKLSLTFGDKVERGQSYRFTLAVRNGITNLSSQASVDVFISDEDIPSLVIKNGKGAFVRRQQAIALEALGSLPQCGPVTALSSLFPIFSSSWLAWWRDLSIAKVDSLLVWSSRDSATDLCHLSLVRPIPVRPIPCL